MKTFVGYAGLLVLVHGDPPSDSEIGKLLNTPGRLAEHLDMG